LFQTAPDCCLSAQVFSQSSISEPIDLSNILLELVG